MFVRLQRKIICSVVFGFLCLLIWPQHAAARGSLSGTVSDSLGAPVPNAKVTLLQAATTVASTTTDVEGGFSFSSVTSGRYHVQVEATGFATYAGQDVFLGSEAASLKVELQIGPLKQQVVITATGTATPVSQIGANVTLLDTDEIQAQNKLDVLEDLRQVPGVSVIQTSQRGGATSLFIEGGESTFNKVVVDGITVNEIGGDFDYAQFSNNGVASVEVLEGANSVLYGADALAGVVSITTRQGTGLTPELQYSTDGGTYDSVNQDVSLGGAFHQFDYFTDFSHFGTKGSYPDDFFHNSTVTTNVGWHVNSDTEVRVTARHTTTNRGTPNAILFYGISDNATQSNQNTYVGATVQNQTTPRWHNLVRFAYEDDNENNISPSCVGTPDGLGDCYGNVVTIRGANGYSATGRAILDSTYGGFEPFPQVFYESEARRSAYAQSDYNFFGEWFGTAGFKYEHEDGSGITRDNYSYFLEGHGNLAHRLYLTAGVGLDDNQLYHFAATPRVSAAYYLFRPSPGRFLTDTKLKFNFGKGVKEPATYEQDSTLFALLTPAQRTEFGVGAIGPERSRTLDAGLEQEMWNGRARLDVTFFDNRFFDLIAFLSPMQLIAIGVPPGAAAAAGLSEGGAYVNASSTKSHGVETSFLINLGHGLSVKTNYTYLDAVETQAFGGASYNPLFPTIPIGAFTPLVGARPFRRPPNTVTLLVMYSNRRFTGALSGYMVSRSDDSTALLGEDENFGNTLLLPNRNLNPSYQKFDLSGRYSVTRFMSFYSSIENLLNERYQPAFGFPALPFAIRGGVTFTIGGEG
jgi:vitamin B12 transporter